MGGAAASLQRIGVVWPVRNLLADCGQPRLCRDRMEVGNLNHSFEFQPINGSSAWDIFCSNA